MMDSVGQVLRDITTLEVNTVVKSDMTARKMPRPRYAMLEVAEKYFSYLSTLSLPVKSKLPEELFSHQQTFKAIEAFAHEALEVPLSEHASEDDKYTYQHRRVILNRIERNCEEICALVEQVDAHDVFFDEKKIAQTSKEKMRTLRPIPFETNQIVRLRKVWEVGTESVAMQTCIQIDGDVCTRLQPKYAKNDELSTMIMTVHQQSVDVSFRMWKELMITVKEFFGTAMSILK